MKRFLRTTAGKVVTFIICILCFCIFAASVVGAVIMAKADVYSRSEEELRHSMIGDRIRNSVYELFEKSVLYTSEKQTEEKQSGQKNTAFPSEKTESEGLSFLYGNIVDDEGNLVFRFSDMDGKVIAASEQVQDSQDWEYAYYIYAYYMSELNHYIVYQVTDAYIPDKEGVCVLLETGMKEGLPENDSFRMTARIIHFAYSMRYVVFVIGALAFALMIACFIILMCVSARRPGEEGLYPGYLNRAPFDLLLVLSIASGVLLLFLVNHFTYSYTYSYYFDGIFLKDLLVIPLLILYMIMLLGLCMSLAARIKQKTLIRNTVIVYVLKGIGKLPLIWKSVLVVLGVMLIDWFLQALASNMWMYFFLSLTEQVIIIPFILYIAWCMRRLKKSGEALAQGNLSYHTNTKGLFWDFKKHGENLNRIADGMTTAVDERLKSERMKTELITNVSHDIKTPLTSIINYAGLIGEEECENPKIKEYAEVLVRQSGRLKRLIEDLVEASKASTGNLDVELVPCDANVFITQAVGEYEEKLSAAQLELVVSQPEKELRIMADGRRMWRIFDNLMNNICKYALPGTRVYLSLEENRGNAVFTFRNTSKDPLNISEEELMERFTRGDASRNTEGNGLGLSIAKSLAELMDGKLKILIDGDLFKALLMLPLCKR